MENGLLRFWVLAGTIEHNFIWFIYVIDNDNECSAMP